MLRRKLHLYRSTLINVKDFKEHICKSVLYFNKGKLLEVEFFPHIFKKDMESKPKSELIRENQDCSETFNENLGIGTMIVSNIWVMEK